MASYTHWISHVPPSAVAAAMEPLCARQPPRMSNEEKRLAWKWREEGKSQREISKLLFRNEGSISRLFSTKEIKPQGRPRILDKEDVDDIVSTLEAMVDAAEGTYEVTAYMLKKKCRFKCSLRTVARALHERGYWFRDLRNKPILTPADVAERYAWAKKYKGKTPEWWQQQVHLHLDNHMFKVATTQQGRKLLAKRRVRGVYRQKGKSLRPGHVKPSPKYKLSTGAKGILKTGGVGNGRVLVWHTVPDRWNGDAAAHLYRDLLSPMLKKEYPAAKTFTVLEDNDPTGNTSNKAIVAKKAVGIKVLSIPRRSPDLNVLDYTIWAEVEKRLRRQERRFEVGRRETRAQFEVRLNRTARNLSSSFIDKAIGDLHSRCQKLYDAKGGLFEEGGRKRRPL